jgi:predicted TIM-barrel fold metal-dependent hydrolase
MSSATKPRLISADDHVDLTQDQVKKYLSPRHHESYDAAVAQVEAELRGRNNVAVNRMWRDQNDLPDGGGRGFGSNNRHPAAGRPGHTDARQRLADMDADGVEASSSYCEVSAFRYLYLVKDGAAEATRAFNTALAEFASADPKRLLVSYQIPIHDMDLAVGEVRWAAANGCKSLQLPVFPNELGLPDYWHERYDPLWSAIQDTDLPVCLHIGLKLSLEDIARRDPTPQRAIFTSMVPMATAEALGMWVLTGLLERHPHLKVIFVEPGIGWVTWWLNFVDDMAARQGYEFPTLKQAPSDYFRRNIHLTFIDEPDVVRQARDCLGVRNVMWSSDYPHPVSSWPDSRATVERLFAGVPEDERDLICFANAARVWNL